MDLVDDIDLIAPTRGSVLNAPDDFFAHVLYTRTACGVEFVDIGVVPLGDGKTLFTRAVGRRRGTVLAQKRLGQQASRGCFARASRPAKQIRMADPIGLDGVFQRAFDMGLPHHVLERLRTILSIQCLCHSVASPISLVRTSVSRHYKR